MLRVVDKERRDRLVQRLQHRIVASEARSTDLSFPLLDLPIGLTANILSRLPLKKILQCPSVCKKFLNLIRARVHLSESPNRIVNLILHHDNFNFLELDLDESGLSSSSIEFQEMEDRGYSYHHEGYCALRDLDTNFIFRAKRANLVGSCNGLLCVYSAMLKPSYCIYNFILREWIQLPYPSPSLVLPYPYGSLSGFGYCPRTKEYKVIHFIEMPPVSYPLPFYEDPDGMMVEIHTLGSDSWRKIGRVPRPQRESFDPYVNGALHWISKRVDPSQLIVALDLDKEEFGFIPPPAHFDKHYVGRLVWINTGVLRDCLCICYVYEDKVFEIWSMREYGVGESWRKELSIDLESQSLLIDWDLQRPIKFLSNGVLVFRSVTDRIITYSLSNKTFRESRLSFPWANDMTAHTLGFTSLRDAAGPRRNAVHKFRVVG